MSKHDVIRHRQSRGANAPNDTIGSDIQPGDLLRVEEAARLATVRPSTIRAWLTQGRLPRVKVGRCTRILRRDLQELICAGRSIESGGM
jgi:excisionase family DNA binding protein